MSHIWLLEPITGGRQELGDLFAHRCFSKVKRVRGSRCTREHCAEASAVLSVLRAKEECVDEWLHCWYWKRHHSLCHWNHWVGKVKTMILPTWPRNRIQVLVGQNHTHLNSSLSRLNAAGAVSAPLIGPFGRSWESPLTNPEKKRRVQRVVFGGERIN